MASPGRLDRRTHAEPELPDCARFHGFMNEINEVCISASNFNRTPHFVCATNLLGFRATMRPRCHAPGGRMGVVRGGDDSARVGTLWTRGGSVCAARSLAFNLPDAPKFGSTTGRNEPTPVIQNHHRVYMHLGHF